MNNPRMLGWASRSPCHHCGRPVRQLYMVRDSVWWQAFSAAERAATELLATPWLKNLHIGCLERRLKRRLRAGDFYFQDAATGVRR